MTNQYVFQGNIIEKCIINRKHSSSRITKEGINAKISQGFYQDLGTGISSLWLVLARLNSVQRGFGVERWCSVCRFSWFNDSSRMWYYNRTAQKTAGECRVLT